MTGADALAQRLDAMSMKTRKPDPRSLTRVITQVRAVDPARAAVANTRLVNCASATLNCVEPFIIARRLQVDEDAGSTDGMVMGGRSQVKSYLVTCRELKE